MSRSTAIVVIGLLIGVASAVLPAPALADTSGCTDTADVSWEVDPDTVTVSGAVVDVPGCEDGDEVGLQLITDDGDVPAEPLVEQVEDERVRFDLEPLNMRIEPVTGVRVLLYGEVVVELVDIVVEQRFFSSSGNEQRGLREVTELGVREGGTYTVPGAPTRYEVVDCEADLDVDVPGDVIEQGEGSFEATEDGRHLVCYQQLPGTPGGPPDVEEPVVDDETDVSDDGETGGPGNDDGRGSGGRDDRGNGPDDKTDVLGEDITRPATGDDAPLGAPTGGPLATTGANVLLWAVTALGLLAIGRRLVRARRV